VLILDNDSPYWPLLGLWPIGFVVIWAIWNTVRQDRDVALVEKSLNWPEVQGTVTSCKVKWVHVEVGYEYVAEGKYRKGVYKSSLSPAIPDHFARGAAQMTAESKQDIAEFPTGTKIIIRYNPAKPGQSVFYCRGNVNHDSSQNSNTPKFEVLS
jgi:hypothetical protein